ncbi:MAG: flagellar basal body rod protein FlgB [Sulfuricellaceae bacterium]|nr:flagellar basal body rod protein FlgB [Sulfuricellaceae bacterium]
MIQALDKEFGFMQNALNLRAYRQQLLASNIANADTPNFKARDIDFAAELQRSVGEASGGQLALATTAAGHVQPSSAGEMGSSVLYRQELQAGIDGNTVNMDIERAQFTDNALHYQFVADRISGKVRDLLLAVKGQ